jgi:hypothetical protein
MKTLHKSKVYLGQLVVVTDHPETQVYTVCEIVGNRVALTWFEGSMKCSSWFDAWSLGLPTLKQIEYSIAANGKLAAHEANLETITA